MNTDNSQDQSIEPEDDGNSLSHDRGGTGKKIFSVMITLFVLLIAVAALLLAYHDYRLLRELRSEMPETERLNGYDTAFQRSAQELATLSSNMY